MSIDFDFDIEHTDSRAVDGFIYRRKSDSEFRKDKSIFGLLYEKIYDMKLVGQLSEYFEGEWNSCYLLNEACYRCTQMRLESTSWAKVDLYFKSISENLPDSNFPDSLKYNLNNRNAIFVMAMIIVLTNHCIKKPQNWNKFNEKVQLFFRGKTEVQKELFQQYSLILEEFVSKYQEEAKNADYSPHFGGASTDDEDIIVITNAFDRNRIIDIIHLYSTKEERLKALNSIESACYSTQTLSTSWHADEEFFDQLRKGIEDDNITSLFPNVNKFLETVDKCVHDGNDGKNEEDESLRAQVEQLKTQLKQANEQLEELKSKQQPITDPDEDVVYALNVIENSLTEDRNKIIEGKSVAEEVFDIKIPFVRSNKLKILHEVEHGKEKMNEANYSHYYNMVWCAFPFMEHDPFNSDELYCGLNTILQYLLKFYDTDKVAALRPKIENIIQEIENSNEEQDTCYCTRNRSKAVIKGIKDFWGKTENTKQAAKVAEYKKNTEEVGGLQAENERLRAEIAQMSAEGTQPVETNSIDKYFTLDRMAEVIKSDFNDADSALKTINVMRKMVDSGQDPAAAQTVLIKMDEVDTFLKEKEKNRYGDYVNGDKIVNNHDGKESK